MTRRVLLLAVLSWCCLAGAAGQGIDEVLVETFDGVEAPAIPPAWTVTNDAWETSTSSESPGSGGNNVFNRGSVAGALTTPAFDLSGAITAELTYFARRTSSYDLANLRVTASADGGVTFPIEVAAAGTALPIATSTYETVTLSLPASLLGQPDVVLQFETFGLSGSTANARLDDVSVTASRLVLVSPAAISFLAMPGGSDVGTVTLTNADAASLQVNAPLVGGTTYSVSPSGPVTLEAGASQVYTVTWSPVLAGTDNRTLLLVHEHGTATVSLEGRTAGGIFGFVADSSRTTPGDSIHTVPTRLIFDDPAGLQGLQFDVSWDEPTMVLSDVQRGEAIADTSAWTLSFNADTATATVVLLGAGTNALSSGTIDSLVSLRFDVPDTASAPPRVQLFLSRVVGALALAGGDDAGIAVRPDSHTVLLEAGEANFQASETSLTLPTVIVGDSSQVTLTLSNPDGTMPLVVDSVASSNPLFSVSPDSLVIAPDSSAIVTITFAPVDSLFGSQSASIRFAHNGATGVDSVAVSAVGEGGRGDAARDGVVDAVDLVQVLDFVLLRSAPDSLQLASGDLYPFSAGDGALDVRDLTVLSHAIVNGFWPDSVSLPATSPESEEPEALLIAAGGPGTGAIPVTTSWTLTIETDVPVRALQAVFAASRIGNVRTAADADGAGALQTLYSSNGDEVRVVTYRADGGLIEAGTYKLLEIEPEGDGGELRPLYVIGVDEDLKRVPVTVAGVGEEGAEREVPGDALRLGLPYPNPIRFSEDERLRLPLAGRPSDGRGRAAVFNLLGQRVRRLALLDGEERVLEWDGRDQLGGRVPPGIYFIRLEDGSGPVRSAVVVR